MLIAESCKLTSARQPNASTLVAASAFVFKDGEKRSDYERALPDLMDYYSTIRRIGDVPFHVEEAARLKLEWWIVQRERQSHDSGDLVTALANWPRKSIRCPPAAFTNIRSIALKP